MHPTLPESCKVRGNFLAAERGERIRPTYFLIVTEDKNTVAEYVRWSSPDRVLASVISLVEYQNMRRHSAQNSLSP